jgi:hypothetical protein
MKKRLASFLLASLLISAGGQAFAQMQPQQQAVPTIPSACAQNSTRCIMYYMQENQRLRQQVLAYRRQALQAQATPASNPYPTAQQARSVPLIVEYDSN